MSIACPCLPPKRAASQGALLQRRYPAPALLSPCPTPSPAATLKVPLQVRPVPCWASLSAPRSPFAAMPCPLLRRTETAARVGCFPARAAFPVSQAGRPAATSLSRPAQAYRACTARQFARPACSRLCQEASTRPITRPRGSSAFMPTDNCMSGLLSPTGCPRRKGALRNTGWVASRSRGCPKRERTGLVPPVRAYRPPWYRRLLLNDSGGLLIPSVGSGDPASMIIYSLISIGIGFSVMILGIVALWLPHTFGPYRRSEPPFDREAALKRLLEFQSSRDTAVELLVHESRL